MYRFFNEDKGLSEEEIIDMLTPDEPYNQQEQKIAKPAEKKKLTWSEIYNNIIDVLIAEGKISKEDGEYEKNSAKSTI